MFIYRETEMTVAEEEEEEPVVTGAAADVSCKYNCYPIH